MSLTKVDYKIYYQNIKQYYIQLTNLMDKTKNHISEIWHDIVDSSSDDHRFLVRQMYNINDTVFDYLQTKDEKWIELFFKFISKRLETNNNVDSLIKELIGTNRYPMDFVNLIFDIKPTQQNTNLVPNTFKPDLSWCRKNQLASIQKSLENKFISGIDLHATGAGKSYIILAKAYYYMQIHKKNVMILCERQYILNNEFSISNAHKLELKTKGIIDLDALNIINVSSDKDKEFHKKIKPTNTLLIANRQYLTSSKQRYQKITKEHNFGLVLYDECHSCSAPKTYNILSYFKDILECKLIGFSATPIRKDEVVKMTKLFGDNNKLNFIHVYNLFDAIIDHDPNQPNSAGCLPTKFYVYELKKQDVKQQIFQTTLNHIKTLHYKKLICWCASIADCEDYYNYFKSQIAKLENIKLYISHNKDDSYDDNYNVNDREFFDKESNCIMFCVNRFREGSNMKTLELGQFLDMSKNRGEIPLIQMTGRTTRPDNDNKKTCGQIVEYTVEGVGKNDLFEKIIGYYLNLVKMTEEDNKTYRDLIIKIRDNIVVNVEEKEIEIPLDDKSYHNVKVKLNVDSINWDTVKKDIKTYINENYDCEIYLVPAGKDSYKNYVKTIVNCPDYVKSEEFAVTPNTRLWGLKHGPNNDKLFAKIKKGSYMFFTNKNETTICKVVDTKVSKQTSFLIWNDEQFENIIIMEFVKRDVELNRQKLNPMCDYGPDKITMGTTRVGTKTASMMEYIAKL